MQNRSPLFTSSDEGSSFVILLKAIPMCAILNMYIHNIEFQIRRDLHAAISSTAETV